MQDGAGSKPRKSVIRPSLEQRVLNALFQTEHPEAGHKNEGAARRVVSYPKGKFVFFAGSVAAMLGPVILSEKDPPVSLCVHFAVARFFQNCFRLSSAPNNVLKTVESASRISPARGPLGGIHTNELNSRLPASVNGCGFDMSIG